MDNWYLTPKLKSAPAGRAISADNFIPEGKKSVSIFVREVFQNIIDARKINLTTGEKEQAIVTFRILNEGSEISKGVHKKYFEELEPYIMASELSKNFKNVKSSPSALVFEETNTIGLKGITNDSDIFSENQHWNLFWHSEAKESKGLDQLGRAGQGKITYNLNSACGSVLAITDQEGGEKDLLYGKCRFPSTFTKDGKSYLGHAFFCEQEVGDDNSIMPLPITNKSKIASFKKDFTLNRVGQSGTSWIIPYIDKEVLNKKALIQATISEFYLAVLKGELIVDIQGEKIDHTTLLTLIDKYEVVPAGRDRNFLIWLIESNLKKYKTYTLSDSWYVDRLSGASDDCLDPVELDDARKRYHASETLHFLVPIPITMAVSKEKILTFGDVYLKKNELDSTKEIYARDCLVIEDERHLKNAPGRNFGAFIANNKDLCYFLGEGDDASHLKWNPNNPRLAENFVGYQMSLAMVRTSLPALAKTISTLDQELYEDLFNDLMSVPVPVKKGANKKKKKRPKRIPVVPRVKKLEDFTIENVDKNTIKISNSATFSLPSSTKTIQIKFAYENFATKGDPFKLYHRFDFDLANFTKKDFVLKNCSIITYDANILELDIENQNFEISIKGFDAHDCRVEINDV